jgi:selenide,water dikinase
MDADVIAQVLRDLPPIADPNVLVGNATADDAGVYRLTDDLALVQTVDFFTPIVDDPYLFGSVAAANALSDIYAMGARPVAAVAIAAFPETFDVATYAQILRGGIDKAREAGIDVIGGHTIKDTEPKYGLAVSGIVHPDRIVRNSTARAGDILYLTKPLGTGILTTARRGDEISDAELAPAIAAMQTLNRGAADAMLAAAVHAATDVTGFGLIGHLQEMLHASGTGANIQASHVPLFEGVVELARRDVVPGGTRANHRQALASGVRFDGISPELQLVLCDAQTSGGLLISLAQADAARLEAALQHEGVAPVARIGEVTADATLRVTA